ncbi:MAG: MBL fold metallo-hydrolase [Oscillospiraceae bacterium]|nr:MBL fold metallo-hydrolase [Oscillospiraceae bacterium]
MELYRHERVNEHITRIFDISKTIIYLVEGTERALVIDTGSGIGDLKAYIETLTELPITVCVTHGHVDHVSGAGWFDEVYLNEKDWALAREHAVNEIKRGYTASVIGDKVDEIGEEHYSPDCKKFLPMEDGHVFDLGGITVEMLDAKGHTQGMMCPLVREDRVIVFGDACNTATFMFGDVCTTILEYTKTLDYLKSKEHLWDRVLLSHGPGDIPKSVLDDNIELCEIILDGKADDMPFEFMGSKQLLAKRVTKHFMREDGKLGNIVYNHGKIR